MGGRQDKKIKFLLGERACLGGGEEEYDVETNTFTGEGVLGPNPNLTPNVTRSPQRRNEARRGMRSEDSATDRESNPSPVARPRASRAAAGDDFLSIMKLQMMQDKEDRKNDQLIRAEERKEQMRMESNRREERIEDRRTMERMFMMAVGGYAASQNESSNKNKRPRRTVEYLSSLDSESGDELSIEEVTRISRKDNRKRSAD